MTRRAAAAMAAVLTVLAVALSLTGCTVTVTAKAREWGLYYLCDGPQPLPCRSGHAWRVTQQEYDAARVGQTYSNG